MDTRSDVSSCGARHHGGRQPGAGLDHRRAGCRPAWWQAAPTTGAAQRKGRLTGLAGRQEGVGGFAYSGKVMAPVAFTPAVDRLRRHLADALGLRFGPPPRVAAPELRRRLTCRYPSCGGG